MNYPSDVTRDQFRVIAPILERARKVTRPRTLDLYDVFNGVLYVITTGCQWRALPKDYPKWRSVYSYFCIWKECSEESTESILEQVLKKIGRRRAYQKWQDALNEHGYC
jgi:transposase